MRETTFAPPPVRNGTPCKPGWKNRVSRRGTDVKRILGRSYENEKTTALPADGQNHDTLSAPSAMLWAAATGVVGKEAKAAIIDTSRSYE